MNSTGHYIEISKNIPAQYLAPFWDKVRRRARANDRRFHNPQLAIIGHDLKLNYPEASPALARSHFLHTLGKLYDTRDGRWSEDQVWLDFGIEDIPKDTGMTLLRRLTCFVIGRKALQTPSVRLRV